MNLPGSGLPYLKNLAFLSALLWAVCPASAQLIETPEEPENLITTSADVRIVLPNELGECLFVADGADYQIACRQLEDTRSVGLLRRRDEIARFRENSDRDFPTFNEISARETFVWDTEQQIEVPLRNASGDLLALCYEKTSHILEGIYCLDVLGMDPVNIHRYYIGIFKNNDDHEIEYSPTNSTYAYGGDGLMSVTHPTYREPLENGALAEFFETYDQFYSNAPAIREPVQFDAGTATVTRVYRVIHLVDGNAQCPSRGRGVSLTVTIEMEFNDVGSFDIASVPVKLNHPIVGDLPPDEACTQIARNLDQEDPRANEDRERSQAERVVWTFDLDRSTHSYSENWFLEIGERQIGRILIDEEEFSDPPAPARAIVEPDMQANNQTYVNWELTDFVTLTARKLLRAVGERERTVVVAILNDQQTSARETREGLFLGVSRNDLVACNSGDELAGLLAFHLQSTRERRPTRPSPIDRRNQDEPYEDRLERWRAEYQSLIERTQETALGHVHAAGFNVRAAITMCGLLAYKRYEYERAIEGEAINTEWPEELILRRDTRIEAVLGGEEPWPITRQPFLELIDGTPYGNRSTRSVLRDNRYLIPTHDLAVELPIGSEDRMIAAGLPRLRSAEIAAFRTPESETRGATTGHLEIDRSGRYPTFEAFLDGKRSASENLLGDKSTWRVVETWEEQGENFPTSYALVETTLAVEGFNPITDGRLYVQYEIEPGAYYRLMLMGRNGDQVLPVREDWLVLMRNVRPMTAEDHASLAESHIEIREVSAGQTVGEFAAMMTSAWDSELEFRGLNGLSETDQLAEGQLMKVVVQ